VVIKLKKKQEAKLAEYRDKWLKIGLSTESPSLEETKKIIDGVYTHLLNKITVPVVVLDNPYLTWIAVSQYVLKSNQVRNQVEDQVEDQVRNQVSNQVWDQVWDQVSNQVEDQVSNQVRKQVRNQVSKQVRNQVEDQVADQVSNQVEDQVSKQVSNQVWDQVADQVSKQVSNQVSNQVEDQVRKQVRNQVADQVSKQVRNQVSNQVWDQVADQVSKQVRNQVRNQVEDQVRENKKLIEFSYPYLDGNFMSSYFSYYGYCIQELKIKIDKNTLSKFNIYKETSKLSLIYPFDDICFVCKKPTEIHFNENKVLHNDKGASIKYGGDFELYHLNGVLVDKKIVITPSEKITVKQILSEKNVEVRRELLRKVGIDNFIKKSKSKPIEISDDKQYELFKIKIGTDKYGMYLKMKNPSLENTYHFEGVSDECNTIEKALAWRDSEVAYIKPSILT